MCEFHFYSQYIADTEHKIVKIHEHTSFLKSFTVHYGHLAVPEEYTMYSGLWNDFQYERVVDWIITCDGTYPFFDEDGLTLSVLLPPDTMQVYVITQFVNAITSVHRESNIDTKWVVGEHIDATTTLSETENDFIIWCIRNRAEITLTKLRDIHTTVGNGIRNTDKGKLLSGVLGNDDYARVVHALDEIHDLSKPTGGEPPVLKYFSSDKSNRIPLLYGSDQ